MFALLMLFVDVIFHNMWPGKPAVVLDTVVLNTVVISDKDVCCSVVFVTLIADDICY